MPVRVMHGATVKLRSMFRWMFTACWERPVIAFAIVEVMIHVSIEVVRPVEPGSRTYKYSSCEPLRAIIAIRSAVVRRDLVVPVGANRRWSNADRNLRIRVMAG